MRWLSSLLKLHILLLHNGTCGINDQFIWTHLALSKPSNLLFHPLTLANSVDPKWIRKASEFSSQLVPREICLGRTSGSVGTGSVLALVFLGWGSLKGLIHFLQHSHGSGTWLWIKGPCFQPWVLILNEAFLDSRFLTLPDLREAEESFHYVNGWTSGLAPCTFLCIPRAPHTSRSLSTVAWLYWIGTNLVPFQTP